MALKLKDGFFELFGLSFGLEYRRSVKKVVCFGQFCVRYFFCALSLVRNGFWFGTHSDYITKT